MLWHAGKAANSQKQLCAHDAQQQVAGADVRSQTFSPAQVCQAGQRVRQPVEVVFREHKCCQRGRQPRIAPLEALQPAANHAEVREAGRSLVCPSLLRRRMQCNAEQRHLRCGRWPRVKYNECGLRAACTARTQQGLSPLGQRCNSFQKQRSTRHTYTCAPYLLQVREPLSGGQLAPAKIQPGAAAVVHSKLAQWQRHQQPRLAAFV